MQHTYDAQASYQRGIIQSRAADDDALTRLALKLYIALLGEGVWQRPVRVYSAAYAQRFGVAHATITRTLRTLEERGYISRRWKRGQRYQLVETPSFGAKE